MDFIDFDSFSNDEISGDTNLPHPQPALSLPITSNIESFGKKFSNFNSLTRNLLKFEDNDDGISEENTERITKENELADKYAKMSLSFLKKEERQYDYTEDDKELKVHEKEPASSRLSLSTRLSRVLNESLSETLMREIFSHLEDKYSNYNNSIDELIEPGMIGSMGRKRLRGKIENELIKNQSLVLKEYSPIIKQLKVIEDRLSKLNELNKTTNENINNKFKFSNELNTKVKELNDEKKLISLKKNLLIAFKAKFTLNEYEEFVLDSGDINDEFFTTLKRAEEINANCSILLSIDNPQLGLKIMSKSNRLINRSVERIINFTNKTLSNLYSLNSKSRLHTLHQCMRYLKNKLNYFSNVINTFVDSRSKVLIDDFLGQIQGNLDSNGNASTTKQRSSSISSDNSSSRPIFVYAHDPIRFIGDLLAYVHSLVVNESDTITSIFTIEDLESEAEKKEFQNIIRDIIDKILKSLAKPIKSKIGQIISAETKLSTSYSIFNLVELYSMMFSKQLSDSSEVSIALKSLVKASQDRLTSIIRNRLASIKTSNSAQLELNLDLQPPEWIIDFYSDILPILDQTTTDTIFNFTPEENDNFLKLIINDPIDVFFDHVVKNKIFDSKRDQLILKENFLDLTLSKILPITIVSDKVIEINEMINNLTEELTQLQLDSILKECELADYYNIVNMICPFTDDFFEVSIYEPIKENKLYTKDQVAKLNETIQAYIPNALLDIQSSLLKLNPPSIVNEVVSNSFLNFLKFYEKFNQINEEFLQERFAWSDYDVATLLGVEEAYLEYKELVLKSSG
ncbi:oligomeric complex COG6-domain-containing protein [Scheffersomyces xylosifermentans]|uniref:oligomeric complex COG6-domain-containing protein n=1 Tax=Scheffersomyces xylosifermentans TaxID=1304137 RepID=UPI00315D1370